VLVLRYVLAFSHRVYKNPYGCYCAKCYSFYAPFNIQFPLKPVMRIRMPIAQKLKRIYIYLLNILHSISSDYFFRQKQNLSFPLLLRCQSVIFVAKYGTLFSFFHTNIYVLVLLMYLNFYPQKHGVYILTVQPKNKHLVQIY
jgi:hypothetical protein